MSGVDDGGGEGSEVADERGFAGSGSRGEVTDKQRFAMAGGDRVSLTDV